MTLRPTAPAFASTLALAVALAGGAATAQSGDLVTRDRVGPADAGNVLTFRLTAFDLYSSDPATAEAFAGFFTDMILQHPGWRIETQLQTGAIAQEQARIIEQSLAGRGPDCAMVDSSQLAAFKTAGVLAPMNDFYTEEELADFFPFVREGITDAEGNVLAHWWFTDLRVLYRDTSVIPDAPETWDELQAAGLASVEAGFEGLLFNAGRDEATAFDWLAHFWAQGGELVDEAGTPVFFEGDNREKFLTAVQFYADLVDSGAAPRRVTSISNYDDMLAAAAAGSTAMFIGGNWMFGQIQNTLDAEAAANWAVSPLPGPTPDQRATGTGGWTIAALSDDPGKVAICADIARLYAGPGNAFQRLLPTQTSLFAEFEAFDGPEFDVFVAALQDGVARPGVAIYPEISNQIQILLGEVLSGASDPETALDAAAAAVMAAYARQ
ncbi:MAG: extracellular solute-binding protein [Rubellimicrobium sp.]|nr:extracellular solute-binding protein [Rubellimicrobium sp.]